MTITAKISDSTPVFDWLNEIENYPNTKIKTDKSVGNWNWYGVEYRQFRR